MRPLPVLAAFLIAASTLAGCLVDETSSSSSTSSYPTIKYRYCLYQQMGDFDSEGCQHVVANITSETPDVEVLLPANVTVMVLISEVPVGTPQAKLQLDLAWSNGTTAHYNRTFDVMSRGHLNATTQRFESTTQLARCGMSSMHFHLTEVAHAASSRHQAIFLVSDNLDWVRQQPLGCNGFWG